MAEQPCWPECKAMLLLQLQSEVDRIEAILTEREKASVVMANNIVNTRTAEMERAFVLQEQHSKDINNIQAQISGSLGMELRLRSLEQSRGVVDAKLYMIIVGVPVAVSAIVSLILPHFMK